MAYQVENIEDQANYRQILAIPYSELVIFIFDYIKRKSGLMIFFWAVCFIFLGIALTFRINFAVYFPIRNIFFHSMLGFIIFPILSIPVHEFLHVITYYFTGARRIRIGMDLKQYMFYVSAHRHVANPMQFKLVALTPFVTISIFLLFFIFFLPGLWKWSLSLFLFVHATMCAGDFAMLNFYWLNKKKKIYTWDDADKKIAYFYEQL